MRQIPILCTVLFLVLAGCAEQRIQGASRFADSAVVFQDSLGPLLDESFNAQLRRNSLQLIEEREILDTEAERLERLQEEEDLMEQSFETTALVKDQVLLLKSVFVALGALADSDADSRIGDAARDLISELDTTSKKAAELGILNAAGFSEQKDAISNIIARGAELVVAQFKSRAIQNFLEDHGATILSSLEIQEQLLSVLSERLKFYGEANLADGYFDSVADPFVTGTSPQADKWTTARHNYYAARVNLSKIDAAKSAATRIKLAFVALAENRLTLDSIALIVQDIARIKGFITAVREVTG